MKMNRKMTCVLAAMAASVGAVSATPVAGGEHYPTIAEVDAEIASLANQYGAKTLWREFVDTAGRIKRLQDGLSPENALPVQWHVVSNMFQGCYLDAALTNDNQVNYQGLEQIVWLHLTRYRLFHANTNALMFVADCVSNALPFDVSHEAEDLLAAQRLDDIIDFGNTNGPFRVRPGTNLACYGARARASIFRYRKLKSFNYAQARFRRMVFNCFCGMILHYLTEYPEPVRRSLWEEFCHRAGATDAEKTAAHRRLYENYKIVYP